MRKCLSDRYGKKRLLRLLKESDIDAPLGEILEFPPRRAVSLLIAALCASDETLKWRAVKAIGGVVADLAGKDMEAARIVMRRLMWNLNEESGGIGWGAPEAMGEIMAGSRRLAEEYGCILASYIQPGGSYIEYDILQRGILWGLSRAAHAWPDLMTGIPPLLTPFLESSDPMLRGLAAHAVEKLPKDPVRPMLEKLTGDGSKISLFIDSRFMECTVGRLAENALRGSTG